MPQRTEFILARRYFSEHLGQGRVSRSWGQGHTSVIKYTDANGLSFTERQICFINVNKSTTIILTRMLFIKNNKLILDLIDGT